MKALCASVFFLMIKINLPNRAARLSRLLSYCLFSFVHTQYRHWNYYTFPYSKPQLFLPLDPCGCPCLLEFPASVLVRPRTLHPSRFSLNDTSFRNFLPTLHHRQRAILWGLFRNLRHYLHLNFLSFPFLCFSLSFLNHQLSST